MIMDSANGHTRRLQFVVNRIHFGPIAEVERKVGTCSFVIRSQQSQTIFIPSWE